MNRYIWLLVATLVLLGWFAFMAVQIAVRQAPPISILKGEPK